MSKKPQTQAHTIGLLRAVGDLLRASSHVAVPVVLLFILTGGGAVGYHFFLGLSFLDALYQSVVTLSTVGFEELRPFDDATKIFTIILIVSGVGTVFYTLTLVVATVIEGELRSRFRSRIMQSKIDSLSGHYVICGFGRVGQEVATGLAERAASFVVVDQDPVAVERALSQRYLTVTGSVTEEDILLSAGVARAKSLLATANSDSVNTYVSLTAKHLNPAIHVVARSEIPSSSQKLRLAGADRVISPHALSGRRMMLSAAQPLVTDFMDTISSGRFGGQILAEFNVKHDSPLDGARLSEAFRDAPGAKILGIRHPDGTIVVGPSGSQVLHSGDMVIVIAEETQVANLDPGSTR